MKTIRISKQDIEQRISRYHALKPLPIQNASIPEKAQTPIRGAAGMTMTFAVCPPGHGARLHSHRQTYGDDEAEQAIFEAFYTVLFPLGVCRAFRNVGDEERILQVIITGGVHDMNDIAFTKQARREIDAVRPASPPSSNRPGSRSTPDASSARAVRVRPAGPALRQAQRRLPADPEDRLPQGRKSRQGRLIVLGREGEGTTWR